MRRHELDPVSLTFGFAFTGLGLLFLLGRADQALRLHWVWPILLLVLGVGILADLTRNRASTEGDQLPAPTPTPGRDLTPGPAPRTAPDLEPAGDPGLEPERSPDPEPEGPVDVEPKGPVDVEPEGPVDVEPEGPVDVEPEGAVDDRERRI
jgi:hypothetical protein